MRAFLPAVVCVLLACSGTEPEGPLEMHWAEPSGNGQTGTVGEVLGAPLRVLVTRGGEPAEGIGVSWRAGGSARVAPVGPTGPDGIAEAIWTLGPRAGNQGVRAWTADLPDSALEFSADARAGPAVRLVKLGDPTDLSGPVGTPLPQPVQAFVGDRFGNAVAGVPVHWRVESGDATLASPSTLTSADGVASTAVVLGESTGPSIVVASSEGLEQSPVRFTVLARLNVFVEDSYFSPAELTVEVGSTVTWVWADALEGHNIVPDLVEPARSGEPGSSRSPYSYDFVRTGVYRYYCELHGGPGGEGMSGFIHVIP